MSGAGDTGGWAAFLDEGERILWQGRPDPAFAIGAGNIAGATFGLFFAGCALLWMRVLAGSGSGLWAFGLLHFTVGLCIVAGALLWPTWRRRHSWYSLSDARAFIATDMPVLGRKLRAYQIEPDSRLTLVEGTPGTVWFHDQSGEIRGGTGRMTQLHGSPGIHITTGRGRRKRRYVTRVGFERIHDAPAVFALMRQIQEGTR